MELTENPNFWNYFCKFGAYTFIMNETKYNELHDIFKTGFEAGLKNYPDVDHKLHYTVIISGKEYLGYKDYGIHTGKNDTKLAQNLQHKATTTMEKRKLNNLRLDVKILDVMIAYTKNIIALSVFNVKFLR